MNRIAITLLILAALSGGCTDDAVQLSPLAPGAVVLAFGDSLTAGYGAAGGQSYPDVLAQLAQLTVINAGVSGELSAAGQQRLPALIEQHNPQLVILCHGGNDLLRSSGNAGAKANIIAMIDEARSQGVEVLLLGVPEPGIFLGTAEFYQEIVEATGVAYIPDLVRDILADSNLKSDQVHPNAAGYRAMAEQIFTFLLQNGAI